MSLQELKNKLENLNGRYNFNFAREEDCAFLFEEYGGEENMKEQFPRLYASFCKARQSALLKNNNNTDEDLRDDDNDKNNQIYNLMLEKQPAMAEGEFGCLRSEYSCTFIDKTKKVCSDEPADPWVGISIQVKIREKGSPQYMVNKSILVKATNQHTGVVNSNNYPVTELENKKFQINMEVKGVDPEGKLHVEYLAKESDLPDPEQYAVFNVVVEDPAPQNDAHYKNQEISMLYGRIDEQKYYSDADYKGGDYYNNAFANGKVHLLMPLKGYILLNYGFEPVGLTEPDSSKVLCRPAASYEYKQQVFTYREDIPDGDELYKKIKDCFKPQGDYNPGVHSRVNFDFQLPESGRSSIDWHSDIEGIQNAEPKTLFLTGRFIYTVKALGIECENLINIESKTKEAMAGMGVGYFEYRQGSNIVYIPPITIYWGCYARDVQIAMYDGGCKAAEEIEVGDGVLGQNGQKLVVQEVLHGRDKSIYHIKTQNQGGIRVSGGHPMLCNGQFKRAWKIEPGDLLALPDGGQAEVSSVTVEDYDDMVYNFTFAGEDEGAYIVANGFYAGDLKLQNQKKVFQAKELSQEDLELIAEVERHQKMLLGAEE